MKRSCTHVAVHIMFSAQGINKNFKRKLVSFYFKVFNISLILSRLDLVFLLPQKQRPKRVKAIYNCRADNPDELTFSEGEVIVVDGEEDQEWWVSITPAALFD